MAILVLMSMSQMLEEVGNGDAVRRWDLSIDLIERDDKYALRADVPGLKAEEVKIEVADEVLTISSSYEESEEDQKDDFVRRERRYGAFSRSISLPKGVTADDIEATCHGGVLEVTFPKSREQERRPVTITPQAT